jgi:hypothetical protein
MSDNQDEVKKVPPTKNRGGAWITFGSEAYRVPPLGLGAIKQMQERVANLAVTPGAAPSSDQFDTILEVVHAALMRNYPDMKLEEVADMVDLQNYQEVLGAVLNISGFAKREEGAPGEALASTGTGSTSA